MMMIEIPKDSCSIILSEAQDIIALIEQLPKREQLDILSDRLGVIINSQRSEILKNYTEMELENEMDFCIRDLALRIAEQKIKKGKQNT